MSFNISEFYKHTSRKDFIKSVEYFDEIDSTNTYLKNSKEIHKKLVIADFQTAGRGRFDRKWISAKGENLTFSFGLENFSLDLISKLNFYIPIKILTAIENLYDISIEIKWPNDLLHSGKKFCGILIENSIDSSCFAKVVIGIGINCNQTEFPEEIQLRTTSLKLILKTEIVREKVLAKIIDEISEDWEKFLSNPIKFYERYKSKCLSIGKKISVSFNNQVYSGIFADVTPNGELVLDINSNQLLFNSGEITILKE